MRLLPLLALLVDSLGRNSGEGLEWKAQKFYPSEAACQRELSATRVEKCLPDTASPPSEDALSSGMHVAERHLSVSVSIADLRSELHAMDRRAAGGRGLARGIVRHQAKS